MEKNYKKINLNLVFILILIIGFLLRYFNNFNQIFWNDENLTLFITEPYITFEEFQNRRKILDESPIIYFYILRLYNNIFYTSEFLRLNSIIFSTLAIFVSYNFFKIFFDKKISLLCVSLISFNIFLIWYAKEARIASSVIFFGLLNIIIFYKFLKKNNFKNKFILFLINLFTLSYYPFLLMIILSQLLYVIQNNRSKIRSYLIIFILTVGSYIYLNLDYILIKTIKPSHHFPLEISFFVNYFFRSFFGSIIFGGLNLVLFTIGIFYLIRNQRNDFKIFNLYIIIITYTFAIAYSFFKGGGVIAPRYFIFLIPSIIFVIVNFLSLERFKYVKYFYLILTLINTFILFDHWKIKKPKVEFLLNNIDANITKNYFVDEGGFGEYKDVYNSYFLNSSLINKKLNYVKKSNIYDYDKIYFICLNHAEMHVGLDRTIQNPKKCNIKLDGFDILNEKEIKDFKLILFAK